MDKKSFVLYTDYVEQIELLPAEEQGTLFVAILKYAAGEELPELTPAARMAFAFIKKQMDKDAEKYEQTKAAHAEAGKQGGAPKGNQNAKKENQNNQKQAKQPNGCLNKQNNQKQAKQPDNDNVNDNDNVIYINPLNPPLGEKDAVSEKHFSKKLENKVREWIAYKKEKRQNYKPVGLNALLSQIENQLKEIGEQKVCNAIDLSMAAGYQGIIFDKVKGRASPKKEPRFLERQYTEEELQEKITDALDI